MELVVDRDPVRPRQKVEPTLGSDLQGRQRLRQRPCIDDVGLDKVVFQPDGSAWILSTGLHVRFVLPSGGLVFGRIGLQIITLDEDGNFVSLEVIGGRFQDIDFVDFICSALA